LLGANSETIQERLDQFELMIIDEKQYGDYVEAARITGDAVVHTLKAALAERKAFEENEKQLAQEKAKLKEEQDKLAKDKAELKASQEAVEQSKRDEEYRIKGEKEREEQQAAAAEAEKKRAAANKKRLPENLKVRAYIDEVVGIRQPKVKDAGLVSMLAQVSVELEAIKSFVYDATTGGEK